MASTLEDLRERSRRAYELGRVRVALQWAVLVAALGLVASMAAGAGLFGLWMAAVATAAAGLCVWYGRSLGRGVWPGIWVGSLAVALALFARACAVQGATSFFECTLP